MNNKMDLRKNCVKCNNKEKQKYYNKTKPKEYWTNNKDKNKKKRKRKNNKNSAMIITAHR